MSTRAPWTGPTAACAAWLLLGVATVTGGCATSTPQAPEHRLAELRLGRSSTPAPPSPAGMATRPALRPRLAAPPEPAPVLPVTLEGAAARVAAYLDQAGFALEQRSEGAARLVSATRMGAPSALEAEAVCGLEALHRPDISSTELNVRLIPVPGGVQVETSAQFIEVDTRLLSGELARQTCRSRGVLEAAVQRAAGGG